MPKTFLYLVQSAARRLPPYLPLQARPESDALFLTYDEPHPDAEFLRGSNWSEGRNRLAELARQRPGYRYYIFMDDDVAFAYGSYARFEELLLQHRPAVGFPVFAPKTLYTPLGLGRGLLKPPFRCFQVQVCHRPDCQIMALHPDVLDDGLLFPLQTRFDAHSIWCTSNTLVLLILNLYPRATLQFNPVVVLNLEHRPYVRRNNHPPQREWLRNQFRRRPDNPQNYIVNPFSADGRARLRQLLRGPLPRKPRLFTEWLRVAVRTLRYRPRDAYGFTPDTLARLIRPDSDLFRQYLTHSPRAPGRAVQTPPPA